MPLIVTLFAALATTFVVVGLMRLRPEIVLAMSGTALVLLLRHIMLRPYLGALGWVLTILSVLPWKLPRARARREKV